MSRAFLAAALLIVPDMAHAQQSAPAPSVDAVDSDFGRYDVNGSGGLDRQEFTLWLADRTRKDPAGQRGAPAEQLSDRAADAFTQADSDGDGSVTKDELLRFQP